MMIAKSRLTAQARISVPDEVRRRLGLGPGAVIAWDSEDDRIVVRRAGRHSSEEIHAALFPAKPEPRSLDELREGIRRNVRARHARR